MDQIPICASTGGLVDTVKEGYTGFHMGDFNVEVCKYRDSIMGLSIEHLSNLFQYAHCCYIIVCSVRLLTQQTY